MRPLLKVLDRLHDARWQSVIATGLIASDRSADVDGRSVLFSVLLLLMTRREATSDGKDRAHLETLEKNEEEKVGKQTLPCAFHPHAKQQSNLLHPQPSPFFCPKR